MIFSVFFTLNISSGGFYTLRGNRFATKKIYPKQPQQKKRDRFPTVAFLCFNHLCFVLFSV